MTNDGKTHGCLILVSAPAFPFSQIREPRLGELERFDRVERPLHARDTVELPADRLAKERRVSDRP